MSFTFGSGAAGTGSGGFGFGNTTNPAQTGTANTLGSAGGLGGFGTAATATAKPTGLAFGTPAAQTTTASTGLSLGGTLGFGSTTTTSASTLGSLLGSTATTTTAGLSLGVAKTTASGFGLGGATTTSTSTLGGGLSFGGLSQPAKTTSSGLTLGASLATTTTSGLSFGGGLGGGLGTAGSGLGTAGGGLGTSSLGGGTGIGLGAATTKTGLTLGAPAAANTTSGFGLGGLGLGGTSGAAQPTSTTVNKGLGGVDPKTTSASGSGSTAGKSGDSKAVKETLVPTEITSTISNFKKYVKSQDGVREDIARMSSKPMYRVQEEVATLKQLVSVVASGLHRNASAIEKLKTETGKELKHAEISQRTKETPPGLQYENTAPTEYFQQLVVDFECRMVSYRQQIEEMESHLASLQQPSVLTPQELSLLLNKVYESFLSLAAQLHQVHEAVKGQKEHYLNYRKVFHGDSTDIFEKRRKAEQKLKESKTVTTVGPTPFTGMSNAAAVAMVMALNRGHQPSAGGAPTLGLNTGLGAAPLGQSSTMGTGLFGNTQQSTGTFGTGGSGFGTGSGTGLPATATTSASTGFGSSFNLGSTNTATVRPLGTSFNTSAGNLFGTAASGVSGGLGFGSSGTGFGTGFTSAGGFGTNTSFGAVENKPFQLQKPPAGNKRGKKT